MDHLVFPDGGAALTELLDGESFGGVRVSAGVFMPLDAYTSIGETPFVLVKSDGGTPGYVDQVEALTLQVNATAGTALSLAQDIRSAIVGENIDTGAGFLDAIKCDRLPTVTPISDTADQAVLLVSVVSRPIN